MIYLILAVVSSSLISVIMRLSTDKVRNKTSMLAANYIVCSLFGAIYAKFDLLPSSDELPKTILFGTANGFLYLISFILLQRNTEKHGVVLSSIFMKLGLLVPLILSILFFNEIPSAIQIAGFVIALISIILINAKKENTSGSFGISLILLLLFGGMADAMSKVYEYFGAEQLSEQFLFYTFFTAFILCLIICLIKKEKTTLKDVIFGAVIGIPNFFASKFLLASLNSIPAVVTYPTFSVATILLVTFAGIVVFKEKLSKVQCIALVFIIFALILLNI